MKTKPMSKRALTGLLKSIKHWYEVREEKAAPGCMTCHLCMLYNIHFCCYAPRVCRACPVFQRTGKKYCVGTPWEEVETLECSDEWLPSSWRIACQAEIDFLISLLPEGVETPPDPYAEKEVKT